MPLIENIPGATPIDDISDLIPSHITTRSELNEWETTNVLKATQKYLSERKELIINIDWLKKIHKGMFDETWRWAGNFRQKNYNLGADWHDIPVQLKLLLDDLAFWEKEDKIKIIDRSVRLHHRLVKIHPFTNGNGRHARLVADIYLFNHNQKLPTWPGEQLINEGDIREQYISALKAADKGNYQPLEKFTMNLI